MTQATNNTIAVSLNSKNGTGTVKYGTIGLFDSSTGAILLVATYNSTHNVTFNGISLLADNTFLITGQVQNNLLLVNYDHSCLVLKDMNYTETFTSFIGQKAFAFTAGPNTYYVVLATAIKSPSNSIIWAGAFNDAGVLEISNSYTTAGLSAAAAMLNTITANYTILGTKDTNDGRSELLLDYFCYPTGAGCGSMGGISPAIPDWLIGKYTDVFSNRVDCSPGYYQYLLNATDCFGCNIGTYQNSSGQISCINCSIGSYQNLTNQSSCSLCAVGFYQPVEGNVLLDIQY